MTLFRIGMTMSVVAAAAVPLAGQATPVQVRVQLVASDYRLAFQNRLAALEDLIARRFAAYLAERVGFLRFVVADSAKYRLTFELNKRDPQSGNAFEEIGFWVRLDGTPGGVMPRYWLPVRPSEDAPFGPGTEPELLTRLATRLGHQDPAWIRDSVLSAVPITDQALAHPNPAGWALKLRHVDLCLQNNSLLEFVNEIQTGAMTDTRKLRAEVVAIFRVTPPPSQTVAPYLEGVFSRPSDPAEATLLADAAREGRVKVVNVFVKSYQHDINACRGRGEGGGS